MDENYYRKAVNLLAVAKFLYKHGYFNDSFSRLYYSLRALARALCGKPNKNKWKHEAIIKCLIEKYLDAVLTKEEKRMLRKMPSIRNIVDYEAIEISKESVNIYIKLIEKIFLELKNGH